MVGPESAEVEFGWACGENEVRQPRLQWYMVEKVTRDFISASKEEGVNPDNLVFIGGIATYLHAKNTIGSRVVNRWRGTHDVDVVVLEAGGAGKIVSRLIKEAGYKSTSSTKSHIDNKKTITIVTHPNGSLSENESGVDIDLYSTEDKSNNVRLNKRILNAYPKPFIKQPVESLEIGGAKVSLPSVLDCLIMKFDVVTVSPELRKKDKNDILTLFMVSENNKKGQRGSNVIENPKELLRMLIESYDSNRDRKIIISELSSIFNDLAECQRKGKIPLDMKIFLPSDNYQRVCREALKAYQK